MEERILKLFRYEHLREDLQGVSRGFADLAQHIAATVPAGPERNVSLLCLGARSSLFRD